MKQKLDFALSLIFICGIYGLSLIDIYLSVTNETPWTSNQIILSGIAGLLLLFLGIISWNPTYAIRENGCVSAILGFEDSDCPTSWFWIGFFFVLAYLFGVRVSIDNDFIRWSAAIIGSLGLWVLVRFACQFVADKRFAKLYP